MWFIFFIVFSFTFDHCTNNMLVRCNFTLTLCSRKAIPSIKFQTFHTTGQSTHTQKKCSFTTVSQTCMPHNSTIHPPPHTHMYTYMHPHNSTPQHTHTHALLPPPPSPLPTHTLNHFVCRGNTWICNWRMYATYENEFVVRYITK